MTIILAVYCDMQQVFVALNISYRSSIKMYKTLSRYTLLWSFVLGAMLGVILYRNKNPIVESNDNFIDEYEQWFQEKGLKRLPLTADYIQYTHDKNINLESQFLYKNVKILCVLLVRKRKNAAAANQTWARQCNDRIFIYLLPEKVQKLTIPQTKLESSWHILCDAIRNIDTSFHWYLILNDDTFAVLENARRMVAPLDHEKGHYLGHATTFWGTDYNAAQAGYILSSGSIALLRNHFNSTENCAAGGRFWKQEDYYLGKHLATLGVQPTDTRDQDEQTTFHGHSLVQLLSPDSFSALQITNYYARSVYPSDKCCSPYAVTFQTIEADKMHTYNYLLYHLEVFYNGGVLGNVRQPSRPEEDEKIWRSFVSEQRKYKDIFQGEMSADAYFELWKSVVNDPMNFNQNIRKWSASESDKQKGNR